MTDEAHYDDLVPTLRAKDAYREFSPGLGYRLGPGHMILTASQDWTYLSVALRLIGAEPVGSAGEPAQGHAFSPFYCAPGS
ncbi:hypothetical protein CNYM01_04936 [Colletotrichum nymphaeae SA-01]|uniref:Uncharacterized protein n=1 Tax=Colletotrichum nymphaeae SA-01 TaxID=1460502 RepID=A0A135T027_9PEZI|nr:hypothetical protein CNYM01_04936 [Colletotrichum nymphaeae SA-01]